MSRLYPLLLALFLVASTAAAQNAFQNEIGIMVGLTVVGDGSKVTTVGVPGAGGALGPGALYAARIQRPWIFESHFSLNHLSGGGTKFTQVYLALQGDYLLSRNKGGVPYVFANIGSIKLSGDLKGTENIAGGGLGYRLPLQERLAVRLEARWRRWLDSDLNEYALLVGGGVRF